MKVATVAGAAYLALLGGKAVATVLRAAKSPQACAPAAADVAKVLIAQPILSGDPGLSDALADNLERLAGARFCWLVDTDDVDAQVICRTLAHGRSEVTVIICPTAPSGRNPKLFKLIRAIAEEPDDTVLLVLDDDTILPRASLGALLAGLDTATIATGLPGYLPGQGWGRLIEQFVANNAALTYLCLRPITLNGMTWAITVGDLRRAGGLETILDALTDDLAVAGLILDSGGTIAQTAAPQWIATSVPSAGRYVQLMHRWMLFADVLLRRQPIRVAATITVLHGLPSPLLWTTLLGATRAPASAIVVLLIRAAVIAGLQRRIHGRVLHRPVLSVVSELLQPIHLAHAMTQRTIVWRTRTYRVVDDRNFRPVPR